MTSTPMSERPTDATTNRSPERRFSTAEVIVHGAFAALIGIGIATAAIMWIDTLSIAIGRRDLVRTVHLAAGLLAPLPLAIGLLSARFRADVAHLERWSPADVQWLRAKDRRSGRLPVARFNAGQKLNAALTLGALIVLIGTGTIMTGWWWSWPTSTRTDATWVHDWTAFALTLAVVGHIVFALRYGRGDGSTPEDPRSTAV
ncbi:MAG: cytochrome b/b6 domain-containing protein [Actinomycetes bacterium]